MKIAFGGKGGVGKTTLAAAMIRLLAAESRKVLAVDADPNSNLARALGFPKADVIKPIVEMKDLIYERMEIKTDNPAGSFYKLNPKVEDIPEKFVMTRRGVNLIVMGTVERGGSGCVCPESTFLRELLKRLVMSEDEDIVMDMEAGIEHLGRSTAISMDALLIVTDPSIVSIETAKRLKGLSDDLKMKTFFIGNRVEGPEDADFLNRMLGSKAILGMVSYYERMREIAKGGSIMDLAPGDKLLSEMAGIREMLRES